MLRKGHVYGRRTGDREYVRLTQNNVRAFLKEISRGEIECVIADSEDEAALAFQHRDFASVQRLAGFYKSKLAGHPNIKPQKVLQRPPSLENLWGYDTETGSIFEIESRAELDRLQRRLISGRVLIVFASSAREANSRFDNYDDHLVTIPEARKWLDKY